MGWFDSDYEANGTTSINQIGQQRLHRDTLLGDLIISNTRTGKNIPDNIRDEIFYGTTAHLRKYNKRGKQEGFHSTIQYEKNGTSIPEHIELLPVISIKDNNNIDCYHDGCAAGSFVPLEMPYYLNNEYSQQLKSRVRVADSIGADFSELSKSVFDPDPIPEYESTEWNLDYGKLWTSAKKACTNNRATKADQEICNHGTERDWYNSLVENQTKQKESTKNITDVYFGFFVSMKTLDMANATALFLTLQPMMGKLSLASTSEVALHQVYQDGSGAPANSYVFHLKAASLSISYGMSDYSYIRRKGVVEYSWDDRSKIKKKKGSFAIVNKEDLDNSDQILETIQNLTYPQPTTPPPWEPSPECDPDNPAYDPPFTGCPTPPVDDGDRWGGDNPSYAPYDPSKDIILELRMQDVPDEYGNPTYLEIRLYGLWASHNINVMRDGENGQAASVAVRGGLLVDMDDPEYEDIIVFPISVYAVDNMPLFMRERLSRESLCLIVDGISVAEIKWYQQGWFKVFMFIVAVVLSVVTGGGSLFVMQDILMAAIKIGVATLTASILMSAIDNPLFAAIAMVAFAFMTGNYSMSSFQDLSMLAVEATGTYLQKKMAQDMLKLQDEAKEFQEEMSEAKKEMTKIEEESGMNSYQSDWLMWLIQNPPTDETADSWAERVLNTDHNTIDLSSKLDIDYGLKNF